MGDWTVRVALRTRYGLILVRNKGSEVWHLTGGKCEKGDVDWRCTAVREVLEETGLTIHPKKLRYHEVSHNKRGKRGRYSLHYCSIAISEAKLAQLRIKGREGEEARLFSYQEIRTMKDIGSFDRAFLGRRKLLRPPPTKARRRA